MAESHREQLNVDQYQGSGRVKDNRKNEVLDPTSSEENDETRFGHCKRTGVFQCP